MILAKSIADIALHDCLSTLLETVSYTWELTSVSMCYSQGDGFNTSLSRLFYLILYTQSVVNYSRCVC